MSSTPYPLVFEHVYQDYIWGGDKIIRYYNRQEKPGIYAESWEVSTRKEAPSVVRNGLCTGRELSALVNEWGVKLLGPSVKGSQFPLLIKLIDSKQRLSVQVHPDDEAAARHGGEAKTEMWYVIDAEPDAQVFAGFKDGTGPAAFRHAIESNEFEDLLTAVPVSKGDAIYIPGGLVHAIDEGCLLLEIQQNSNTTYRIYDWGRVGHDGDPRELHIDEALKVIRWQSDGGKVAPSEPRDVEANQLQEMLVSPYFKLERLTLSEPLSCRHDGSSFHVLFTAMGSAVLRGAFDGVDLSPGTSCLVPACIDEYEIDPSMQAEVLRISVP